MVSLLLPLLSACTHLAVLDGAVPLDPGAKLYTTEIQVSRVPSAVGSIVAVPLPTVGFTTRKGVAPGRDIGLNVSTLGAAADVRQRIGQLGPVHLAVQPTVGLFVVPALVFNFGTLDVSLPLRAELPLGKSWSIAAGPTVIGRQTFYAVLAEDLSSAVSTLEAYAGGSARVAWTGRRLQLSLGAGAYRDMVRATGLYGGVSLGIGLLKPAEGNEAVPAEPADRGAGSTSGDRRTDGAQVGRAYPGVNQLGAPLAGSLLKASAGSSTTTAR